MKIGSIQQHGIPRLPRYNSSRLQQTAHSPSGSPILPQASGSVYLVLVKSVVRKEPPPPQALPEAFGWDYGLLRVIWSPVWVELEVGDYGSIAQIHNSGPRSTLSAGTLAP